MITPDFDQNDSLGIDFLENCEHPYCIEGYCETCGFEMGPKIDYECTFGDNFFKKGSNNHSYEDEINKIEGASNELIKALTSKLSNCQANNRESNRSFNVFCAAYVTGVELGEIKPDNVVDSLEMKSKTVNKSLRAISGTGVKTYKDSKGKALIMPVVSISPLDKVAEICNSIDPVQLGPHINKIKAIISEVIRNNPTILNDRPKYVAAGFIKFYCNKEGLSFKDISTKAGMSNPTLNQCSSKAASQYAAYCQKNNN
jgi:hypothetical protein